MTKIKMLKIDGVMNAVDLETGEIVNDVFPVLPDAYNTTPAVEAVLFGDADNKPLISTTAKKTETRGRKAKVSTNPYASVFANMFYDEDTGRSSLGGKMDDLMYSVATTAHYSSRIPVKQLAFVMKSEELSTDSIMEQINKRRFLQGEKGISERYARVLRNAADILVRRLGEPDNHDAIQLDASMAFNFEVDTAHYARSGEISKAVVCPIEFTEGDKDVIRRLAIAGLDAQIESHINQITEQSGRMMRRIEGEVVPLEQVYQAISNEFPFEVALEVVEPEPAFLDADDAWLDSVLNGEKKEAKEPDDWGVAFQSSSNKYTNELGEEW